ncbi:hypothetical protein [Endozoicomonas arenosclerae]|uniref:hypothetical protein n=1 Tax=Endozoicomonas arenosclerae TaxID=1633495 RepID=UPI000781F0B6|nr:hypothetical protein [Endozoicomonas arenosclerae]
MTIKKDLSQMGDASVFITEWLGQSCIQKTQVSDVERFFYRDVAPILKQSGVHIPKLIDETTDSVILEYIPDTINPPQLISSSATYHQLKSIHDLTLSFEPTVKVHKWSVEQTTKAMRRLSPLPSVHERLAFFQTQSSVLFDVQSFVSGDANPGNWAGQLHQSEHSKINFL